MKIKEGVVYHIKDEYFNLVKGCGVKNKTNTGRTYPAYCCCVDEPGSLIWMIPMSTKVDKYKIVYDREMERYGHSFSFVFGDYDEKYAVFQVQSMFPVAKEHILHAHTRKGMPIPVDPSIRRDIRHHFDKLREFEKKGIKCILSDIKRAEQIVKRLDKA